jgi:O-antigen/teichoic acid export membrane protein
MRFLSRLEFGTFQVVFLFSSYLSLISLGVFDGLLLKVSAFKDVQSDNWDKTILISASYDFALFSFRIIFFLLLLFLLIYGLWKGADILFFTIIVFGLNLSLQNFKTFFEIGIRLERNFDGLQRIYFFENLFYILGFSLILFLGYWGRLISEMIKTLYGLILRRGSGLIFTKHGPKFNFPAFKVLVRSGLPIMLSVYLWNIFFTLDQFMIFNIYGIEMLADYGLTKLVIGFLPIIPNAIENYMYSDLSSAIHYQNSDSAAMFIWKKVLFFNSIILIPISIAAYILLPLVVEELLPNYIQSVRYAQMNLFIVGAMICFSVSGVFSIAGRLKNYIIPLILMTGVFYLFVTYFQSFFNSVERIIYFKILLFYILGFYFLFKTRQIVLLNKISNTNDK